MLVYYGQMVKNSAWKATQRLNVADTPSTDWTLPPASMIH